MALTMSWAPRRTTPRTGSTRGPSTSSSGADRRRLTALLLARFGLGFLVDERRELGQHGIVFGVVFHAFEHLHALVVDGVAQDEHVEGAFGVFFVVGFQLG